MISPLESMMRDKVTLFKQNGEKYENIKSNVQTKKIFINDSTLPIEEGDYLVRELPNGLEENYLVIDRGFYSDFHGIKAHYQVSVQKETTRKLELNKAINNYNFNGTSEKINVNSIDNSVNVKNIIHNRQLFDNMREVAKNNSEIISAINEMEKNVGKQSFKDSYNKFIQNAANHMTLMTPFIPVLTELLTKSI
jgi:hypothetical protein